MAFVLDASVALAWCFADEATPDTNALLDQLAEDAAFVPQVWALEVANGLVAAERRQRVAPGALPLLTGALLRLPILEDERSPTDVFAGAIDVARRFGLSVYDATYLELAMRLTLPLATLDRLLSDAARQAGIPLMAP